MRSRRAALQREREYEAPRTSSGARDQRGRSVATVEAFDKGAPFRPLVDAFVADAEKLDDQRAVRGVGLDRGDMAVLGRLAHGPELGDLVGAQVHMERLVHDVDPWAHWLDGLDSARVNLDAAAAAHEGHDRHFTGDGAVQHG